MTKMSETKVTRMELAAARGGISTDSSLVTVTCPESYDVDEITAEDIIHDAAITIVES